MDIVIAFITGCLGPVIAIYIRHYLEKKKTPNDLLKEALEVGNLISAKLDHIKEDFHADRVWVSQFHNGGHFYPTGKSIAKFSIFYETVTAGINSIQNNFQNIPVNLFSKSINHLLENDIIEIYDYKDEELPTYGMKYIAEETGCKSSYLVAIKTIDDKFIGVLGLEYVKRKTKLDSEKLNSLTNHAATIGGVLINHLNKKS